VKATRMILTVGAVVSMVVLAGCSHTVEIVVQNSSEKALRVKASGPGIGVKHLGTVEPISVFRKDVTLDDDVLPANLQVSVGEQSKVCRVSDQTDQIILRIMKTTGKLERGGQDSVTEEKKIDMRRQVGGPETIFD